VELLTQKQKLLTKSIEQTTKKLEALRDAEKRAQKAFKDGKLSEEQYNALKREIIDTEIKLGKLKSQATETNNTIRTGAGKAEAAVDGIGAAASGAKGKLQKLEAAAKGVFDSIKSRADKAAKATQGVSAGAGALGAAMFATVPGTQDMESDLSKLRLNAEENGVAWEYADSAMQAFFAHSGELDSSVEAVSNLLQAGVKENNLAKAVDVLSGAAIRFPDTLKIESLADSLQETVATGEATGQYAELLERLGYNLEDVNGIFANCTDEQHRLNYALNILANEGLGKTHEKWQEQNEALVENREANYELQESLAELGVVLAPLLSMLTELLTGLVEWFTGLDEGTQTAILAIIGLSAVLSPALSMISTISGFLGGLPAIFGGLTAGGLAVGAVIIAAIAALAIWGEEIQAGLQKVDDFMNKIREIDFTVMLGPTLGTLMNLIVNLLGQVWDLFSGTLSGLIDFIQGVFSGDWERAWNGILKIGESIFNNLLEIAKTPINTIIDLINGAIDGANRLIEKINKFTGLKIPTFGDFNLPMFANGGSLASGSAIVGEAGAELLTVSGGVATVTPLNINVTNHNNFGSGYTHASGAAASRDLARQIDRELGRVY